MGRINSIFTGSALDGPGVRTVVFFQGCPLRCVYCHNPETQSVHGGRDIDENTLFEKISRYSVYYGEKGGVTFSGGEPLMQPDFLGTMLRLCKDGGIHTAVDTSGFSGRNTPLNIIKDTDLFLLDIKMTTEEDYQKYMRASLKNTLDFLDLCQEHGTAVWIRQVVVPGINDSCEQIRRLRELAGSKKCVEKIELLPFEKLCITKYNDMGIPFPLKDTPAMDKTELSELQKELN